MAVTIRRDGVGADAWVSIYHSARALWIARTAPLLAFWALLTRVVHDIRAGHAPPDEIFAGWFLSIGALVLVGAFI